MIKTREELSSLLTLSEDLSNYNLIIWGTGNTSSLYLQGIHRLGIDVLGYSDNNPKKWGTQFDGKNIYSPKQVKEIENVLVLISSPTPSAISAISEQLQKESIKYMHIDEYIFKTNSKDILACYDLLDDEFSKDTFAGLIECRMLGTYPDINIIDRDQYFSFEYFSDNKSKEVYIDCGAYVGDTIEKYIWKNDGAFKKIIGFEPDRNNLKALDNRLKRLKNEWNISDDRIEIYPYGLADFSSVSYVERYGNNNGFGSKIVDSSNSNSEECKIVSIDDFIHEEVGFIKADIESYEYKLLEGARNIIKEYSPKLAICIYHNAADFYQIPMLIKKINSKYRIAIRHYTCVLSETVVYAYM